MPTSNRYSGKIVKKYTPKRESSTSKLPNFNQWRGFFWATRTRILFWYVLIITFIFLVSIPAFQRLLYARVDSRVRRELKVKIHTFNQLIENEADTKTSGTESEDIKTSGWVNEADDRLVGPKSKKELQDFFNAFLAKQLPEDDTFLLTFVDGEFYKSSPRGRPRIFDRDSKLMQNWAKQVKAEQGEKELSNSKTKDIIYFLQPVKIQGKTLGVFVVVHTIDGERGEVIEAVSVVIQVSSIVVLISLLLSWLASGKVLAPLRAFGTTARSISESDLSQRIPIAGKDELADVGKTFNEMMDRLEATFITQRNFINDAGHELRTPITIIRGHLELMDDENREEVRETVALLLDELDRMSRFVEDLILLAKAERPDFLQLETVNISIFTQELFAKAQALAERNWCLDKTAKGMIVVDRQRLTQAMMNLAQNATQHTTTTDTIAIGSSIIQGKVKFWVRDTGEGINETDKHRIFERFARAANSRRRSEGAGLGLSIVKAIVEAHDGEVILHSKPREGANFCIILPINS